jgi:hypothetical protein
MKNILIMYFVLTTGLLLFSNQRSIAQIDLRGSWYAYCVLENPNSNSISFNSLCQFTMSENRSEIQFQKTKLIFSESNDSFSLITELDSTKIYYQINSDLYTLDFTYRDIDYSFNILTVFKDSQICYILKSQTGGLILMEKYEN